MIEVVIFSWVFALVICLYVCIKKTKTKKMKECKCDKLLKLEQELTMMFDSDLRVAMALLDEIRKLNQNKEDEN